MPVINIDSRKRGCSNTACSNYLKHKKFGADTKFCPLCGAPTMFVCASLGCFKEIQDLGKKHRFCKACEAKHHDHFVQIKKAGDKVVGAGVLVAGGAAKIVMKDGTKVLARLVEKKLFK